MVRELIHDPELLAKESREATQEDLSIGQDLLDTLEAHRDTCVGMAANMIGETVRIIVFDDDGKLSLMFNPRITRVSGEYETQESCLSLLGGPRAAKRYRKIKVEYQDQQMKNRQKNYEGWTAQIIQHEVDHCNGILI